MGIQYVIRNTNTVKIRGYRRKDLENKPKSHILTWMHLNSFLIILERKNETKTSSLMVMSLMGLLCIISPHKDYFKSIHQTQHKPKYFDLYSLCKHNHKLSIWHYLWLLSWPCWSFLSNIQIQRNSTQSLSQSRMFTYFNPPQNNLDKI